MKIFLTTVLLAIFVGCLSTCDFKVETSVKKCQCEDHRIMRGEIPDHE